MRDENYGERQRDTLGSLTQPWSDFLLLRLLDSDWPSSISEPRHRLKNTLSKPIKRQSRGETRWEDEDGEGMRGRGDVRTAIVLFNGRLAPFALKSSESRSREQDSVLVAQLPRITS